MAKYDFIIIGAGIIGLTTAHALKTRKLSSRIIVIDKEEAPAFHASGRNSGVLHAGFYYTADSLKAKFTVEGNRQMKAYARSKGLAVNECGKLVVAQNEYELGQLDELLLRGQSNGANVRLIDEYKARELEPNVRTHQKALHSPDTASIDPKAVCRALKEDLTGAGVEFVFGAKYLSHTGHAIHTTEGDFEAQRIVNCARLYADKIAQDFGFGKKYTMIPFKGLYLKYTKNKTDVRMHIYPVPNLKNPFLGVHFTKLVDGTIKIGPTAIPAFWRENYRGGENFNFKELVTILGIEALLFCRNQFQFRDLAFEEFQKYKKDHFVALASQLVKRIDPA